MKVSTSVKQTFSSIFYTADDKTEDTYIFRLLFTMIKKISYMLSLQGNINFLKVEIFIYLSVMLEKFNNIQSYIIENLNSQRCV